jgi:hypothetical protein
MKKIIILIFLFIPIILYSQRFNGGLILGFNASQIDGDDLAGYNKAGLMGGVFVFTDFNNKWRGQMEFKYSAKGSSTPKSSTDNYKYRLQYFEIPLLAEYAMFSKVHIQVGGSFGYLFNASINDGLGYTRFESDVMPYKTELALCTGLNAMFFDQLYFNVRFSYSLLPVREKFPNATYTDNGTWYNNVVTFGIYYKMGKGSR